MTPSAHIQSTIELLSEIFNAPQKPCDFICQIYFKQRRFIGAKDRRIISDRIYNILRHSPFLNGFHRFEARIWTAVYLLKIEKKELAEVKNLFSGEQYAPSPLSMQEINTLGKNKNLSESQSLSLPESLFESLKDSLGENLKDFALSSLKEGSFDLRVNGLKSTRDEVSKQLQLEGLGHENTSLSPWGIRFSKRHALLNHSLLKEGVLEVQDEGSQLLAYVCEAKPGLKVLDYCAGAGGKTLALASDMQNKGQLYAYDIHTFRLDRAKERVRRAGISNLRFLKDEAPKFLKRHHNYFDRVLVDVPCSGTGTWRRNPDLKMKTTIDSLDHVLKTQREILKEAAPLVKSGGYIIYGTCSVLKCENQDQIEWFLNEFDNFKILNKSDSRFASLKSQLQIDESESGINLWPFKHNTDGFFMCVLVKE